VIGESYSEPNGILHYVQLIANRLRANNGEARADYQSGPRRTVEDNDEHGQDAVGPKATDLSGNSRPAGEATEVRFGCTRRDDPNHHIPLHCSTFTVTTKRTISLFQIDMA
jgi:hypothetical protein